MKLQDIVGNLTLSESATVKRFRMKINQHSFRQLYSKIYSDGIFAVIRELSTNAYDAHVAAGKQGEPFEVHLPNALEPYFYVKDNGTGMAPEMIDGDGEGEGLYITFWDSNKSNSDDFTGCLGLGSKSPYATTDSFTVENRWKGRKYLYTCTHNESGEPCIVQMGSMETDEPDGMKIEFAVEENEFVKFYDKARTVLSWFAVKPKVIGYADFEFDKHDYLRRTDRYGVTRKSSTSYAIMGNVAYPINVSDFSYSSLTDIERRVLGWGLHLFLDIGDVEFVPSREKLAISHKTISGLKKYMGEVIQSIKEELVLQVQQQPTIWQARRMLYDIRASVLGSVRSMADVTYQGQPISDQFRVAGKPIMDVVTGDQVKDEHGYLKYEDYPILETMTRKRENYGKRVEHKLIADGRDIFVDDLERGGFHRAMKYLRDRSKENAYFITIDDNTKQFLVETGISEVMIMTSSLPKILKPRRAKVGLTVGYEKRTTLQEFLPSNGNNANYWKDVEYDLRDGGVYVITSYSQVLQGENKISPDKIKREYNLLQYLDPNFKIHAIRPVHLGKMGRYAHKWVKYEDYAKQLIASHKHLLENAILVSQYDRVHKRVDWENFSNETFTFNSPFGKLLTKLKVAKALKDDNQVCAYAELCEFEDEILEKMEAESTNLHTVYPLFDHLHWYRNSDNSFVREVTRYIHSVDETLLRKLREAI